MQKEDNGNVFEFKENGCWAEEIEVEEKSFLEEHFYFKYFKKLELN